MTLPAAPKPESFDQRLHGASEMLGVAPGSLVSIKIRPIEDVGDVKTDFLSVADYKFIDEAFSEAGVKPIKPNNLHNTPGLYELKGGQKIVYLRHESGPEIILALGLLIKLAGAVGSFAVAARQVVLLINSLNGRVSAAPSNVARKGSAGATSLEKRLNTGQKVLKQFAGTVKAAGEAIKSVQELVG